MKSKILIIRLLLIVTTISNIGADTLPEEYHWIASDFRSRVLDTDIFELSQNISYPIYREFPLKPIYNSEEFINQYYTIFDLEFINAIIEDDNFDKWSVVGWRGIMFDNGELWFDYDGRLFSINYQSRMESYDLYYTVNTFSELFSQSVPGFYKPVAFIKTETHRILIDEYGIGYRYSSWRNSNELSNEPDLVIESGEFNPEGTIGSFFYLFSIGSYEYELYGMGHSFLINGLIIRKDGEIIQSDITIPVWNIN